MATEEAHSAAALEQVAEAVRGFVSVPEEEKLGAATVLLEGGLGLDSITLLEILLVVEERTGCAIAPEDLTPESVATLGSLAALVAGKLAAGDA